MPITLRLHTGRTPDWEFSRNGKMEIAFSSYAARLDRRDWDRFVAVVKQRSPARWRSEKPIPELAGNHAAREVLRGCTNTTSYQILLAGVDIVHTFGIADNPDPTTVIRSFRTYEHIIRSVFGPGGIYFVPCGTLADAERDSLDELLDQNKLGRAELKLGDDGAIRYYVPYATPITLEREMPAAANRLWDRIRTEYYAFRHPMLVAH